MLPDVGATEYLVIAIVALIVVGPKDLPVLLKKLGQFLAKLRGMASEFRASFDEMARQSELDELRKEVEAMRSGQLTDMAAKAAGFESNAAIEEINQGLADVGVQLHPPMSYQYEAAAVAGEMQPVAAARMPRAKSGVKRPAKSTVAPVAAPKTAKVKASKPTPPGPTASKPAPSKAAASKAPAPKVAAAKVAAPKTTAPKAAAPKAIAKSAPRKPPANPRRPTVERG